MADDPAFVGLGKQSGRVVVSVARDVPWVVFEIRVDPYSSKVDDAVVGDVGAACSAMLGAVCAMRDAHSGEGRS